MKLAKLRTSHSHGKRWIWWDWLIKQILDTLGSFMSYSMTKIQTFVRPYYIFCQRSDISTYIIDLLDKNKYLCDNIEKVSNWSHSWNNMSDKIIGLRIIFSPYYSWRNCYCFFIKWLIILDGYLTRQLLNFLTFFVLEY